MAESPPDESSAEPSLPREAEVRSDMARIAREVEEAASAAEAELRSRAEAASAELGRRREDAWSEPRRMEETRAFPGVSSFAIELLIGALRLVRTIATAPLRIGLAFLRAREA